MRHHRPVWRSAPIHELGSADFTDSGGFQVFSLSKLRKLTEAGYAFQSHIDGSRHMLSPEKSIEVQICLNSDIIMCLDQCLEHPATHEQAAAALALTTRWARRCKTFWQERTDRQNSLFGIVQGGMFADLRARSAEAIAHDRFSRLRHRRPERG
jgi:queuine tRNA-ribosyltransferase